MNIPVEIWLRGDNHATTHTISPVTRDPRAWSDADVASVLVEMLRLMDREKHQGADPDRPVALRGFSWIVNPFEDGGVVIAIEISMGAAVAGPFAVEQAALENRIARVLAQQRPASPSSTVH